MERERGRTSRASSTSSLGLEVHCRCQYYQSDSLLPERKALVGRPPSRTTMETPPPLQPGRCEHEYEPIATPPSPKSGIGLVAPVVRITDTDVVPVADSDESIDVQERFLPKLTLDGDVVLPLDGQIEDNAMEGRELGETVDTSEDQETAQQLQDRLEERFLNTATPCTESRTDGEINTSQVDSSALEELPLRRGARGFPQRLRFQAGKLRSRLRGIQRPSFSLTDRQKSEKTKTTKPEKPKIEKRTKIEKLRSSLSERPRFSLPDRPKFSFPDRSKFHLPERPKFSLPERPRFSMPERPKFNIKRPNIHLPSLSRTRRSVKERQQRSTESTSSSKRNIFDFTTYPRIFDKKSKNRGEYATSSPKDSRAQSTESSTFPRTRKKGPLGAGWAQRFTDIKFADDESKSIAERVKSWRRPSVEEPQVVLRQESSDEPERLPWEESGEQSGEHGHLEGIRYEQNSGEMDHREVPEMEEDFVGQSASLQERLKMEEDSYEEEEEEEENIDPRLYGDQGVDRALYTHEAEEEVLKKADTVDKRARWQQDIEEVTRVLPDSVDSYKQDSTTEIVQDEKYLEPFQPMDPRKYKTQGISSSEEASIHSEREQQSSGSSVDRRRRGVLEEIDSDEYFLREKGISQDDMNVGRYLANEIRDAFRSPIVNALTNESVESEPPKRPVRTRSLRKRKDDSIESYNTVPPARPKRDNRRSEESDYSNFYPDKVESVPKSRHCIIYQAETIQQQQPLEPLDDIVVVKPARRKSRSSVHSYSQVRSESLSLPEQVAPPPSTPPVVPRRRKRVLREIEPEQQNGIDELAVCNGHRDWSERLNYPVDGINYPPEVGDVVMSRNVVTSLNQETLQTFVMRLDQEFVEPETPIAPKRLSRSRATSLADDDRTSHGAESLPEVGYGEDDIPRDADSRDPPGYAIIEKRDKPPRPPPPRRRRDKFATTPRLSVQSVPSRPQRAYSTLGPTRGRSLSDTPCQNQLDVTPYTEPDYDDGEHKDLRSGEILSKMQGRPLPAPPRPPRNRKECTDQYNAVTSGTLEVVASTQTDPLPDDMVIEEEVTQAKLVMAPSRSGSQVLVSMERIPSPTLQTTSPVIPPLPQTTRNERHASSSSLLTSAPNDTEQSAQIRVDQVTTSRESTTPQEQILRSALLSGEPLKIVSLEVADLKVDRLSVSQLDAHKISASEIDAIVVSASEVSSLANTNETGLHPSLLRELIAIRSHLENVANSQSSEKCASLTTVEGTTKVVDKIEKNVELSEEVTEQVPMVPAAVEEVVPTVEYNLKQRETIAKEGPMIQQEILEARAKELQETVITSSLPSETQDLQEEETSEFLQTEFLHTYNVTPDPESKVEETHATLSSPISTPNQSLPSLTSQHGTPEQIQTAPIFDGPSIVQSTVTDSKLDSESTEKQENCERKEQRSRSTSPNGDAKHPVRQTASPVKSLPPVISVTPDTPEATPNQIIHTVDQPQRAVISYSQDDEEESRRETSQSPQPSLQSSTTQFIAFPTSQIPAQFFSLIPPVNSSRFEPEPSIAETTQQLLRALRIAGTRAMRHFVGYVASRVSNDESNEKIKQVELALCALLLLITGLLILCFGSPRTITQHHHWDYFNPPQ